MPQLCTVCTHPERAAIDAALVAGEACTRLAARYSPLTRESVRRHKEKHLPEALTKATEAREVANADDLLSQVRALHSRAVAILEQAEKKKSHEVALRAIREARGCLELLAKLMGELNDAPIINVTLAPQWIQVRGLLLEALAPYPDARASVAAALVLMEVENNEHRIRLGTGT